MKSTIEEDPEEDLDSDDNFLKTETVHTILNTVVKLKPDEVLTYVGPSNKVTKSKLCKFFPDMKEDEIS